MSRVAIAIPTFRRPDGLESLLNSLAALKTAHDVHIYVGDNDAVAMEGKLRAEKIFELGYRWPIEAFVVDTRGISQVRNALIDACTRNTVVEFICMLDDDEAADSNWLDEMLRVQAATGADVVGGHLNRFLGRTPPKWASNVPYLSSKSQGPSGVVDLVDSSGNILFTRSCIDHAARPIFDLNFGMTGGEDKEALTRLKLAGAQFAWAEEAVVTETIPASRVTEAWVMQRSFRIGNSDMRVLLRHSNSVSGILNEIAKAVVVLTCTPWIVFLSFRNTDRRIKAKMKLWRAAGKIASVVGFAYREYAVTHS